MVDTSTPDYSAEALKALADALHHLAREQRRLEALGAEASAEEIRALLAAARSAFTQLYRDYGGAASAAPALTMAELIAGYWRSMDEQKEAISTGLHILDDALGGGFLPGRLVILLGAPGSGKTTLANQIAETIANHGRPVVYVTGEDTPMQLLAKTMARVANLDYTICWRGYRNRKAEIDHALSLVYERTSAERLMYVHDTGGLDLEQIRDHARKHFARFPEGEKSGGPGLLVIDYLQRFARSMRSASGLELRELVGKLTEDLRSLGRELGCTVLALSSQNRANGYAGFGKEGGQPIASAKESGDVEYACDVMLALAKESEKVAKDYAPGPGHTMSGLRIVKNRQGEADKTLVLDWYGSRQHFTVAGKGTSA